MQIGKIIGTVVATRKDPGLEGFKLHVIQSLDIHGLLKEQYVVAVDVVGAGAGDVVLYAAGSSARQTRDTQGKPVDTTIVGIVDHWDINDTILYKEGEYVK